VRIGIVTSDSFFSYLLISDLVMRRPQDIACIVITPARVKGRGAIGSVALVWRKSGWANLVYKVVAGLWVYFAEAMHRIGLLRHCITPSNLAKRYGIDLFHSGDCNDEETLAYLRARDIDVLLSVNVYQRMHEPLLSLPKITALNNHFGLLPKYRGMAPYVWALANGEKEIGLSVHHMLLEFDRGRLVRQERMPLRAKDSAMGVYLRGCLIARKMISDAVANVEHDPDAGFDQAGEGSYFSMPTRKCIAKLKRRGHSLWRMKDLLSVLHDKMNGQQLP